MVSSLIARAQESDTVLGPVSWLFHRQIDAVRAMAEVAVVLARAVTDALGPAGLVALGVLVLVPIALVLLATLTGAAKALAA